MNPAYQRALAQLDELMADIRKQAAASCSTAEREDLTLTRLNALKHSLRPEHSRAIADINRYHQRHFHFHTHEHH